MSSPARKWLRRGRFVAFMGLDGSGKSTLIERTTAELRSRGIHVTYRHQHPGLLPQLSRLAFKKQEEGPVTDPHGKPPSGSAGSTFRLLYYTADYVLGYVFLIWPSLIFSKRAVIFDRYFYDYLVDPLRCRMRLPAWLPRALAWVVPAPDRTIVLAADAEALFARKPELPLAEFARQVEKLASVAGKLPHVTVVDTTGPVHLSAEQASNAVLELFGSHASSGIPLRRAGSDA